MHCYYYFVVDAQKSELQEELSESNVFDLNEGIETIREACFDVTFNETENEISADPALCFMVVTVYPSTVNSTFEPLELTIPVCRPGMDLSAVEVVVLVVCCGCEYC